MYVITNWGKSHITDMEYISLIISYNKGLNETMATLCKSKMQNNDKHIKKDKITNEIVFTLK